MQVGLVVGVVTQRVAGELRQAVVELLVEQVKLQFKGHHRVNAFVVQAFQDLGQYFPRFEFDRRLRTVRGDQHLAQRLRLPAHRLERARYQAAVGVGVAVVEAVITDLEQPALNPQQHGVLRQLQGAAGGDFFQHLHRVALAVEMPGDVQGDQVDITHVGVVLAKAPYFGQQRGGMAFHGCSS